MLELKSAYEGLTHKICWFISQSCGMYG